LSRDVQYLNPEERDNLLLFMKRRQLKERVVARMKEVKEQHKDADGISAAKNASYETLVDSVATSLSKGLLDMQTLMQEFDEAELAGRQHVLLFQVPPGRIASTRQRLTSKAGAVVNRRVSEFLQVPTSTTVHLLVDTQKELIVKLVSRRVDWDEHVVKKTEDLEVVERRRTIERTSIILKYTSAHNLLQIRIPPRGGFGIDETSRKVYLLANAVLDAAYGKEGPALLQEVGTFPLGHAYSRIVANRDDFIMLSDSPESPHFRAMFARRGASGIQDIREMEDYSFHETTFARTMIRGAWRIGEKIHVHTTMHWERVKTGPTTQRDMARVYFPSLNTDAEVEHVIGRICEHAV
jgi:hypothetical protein